MALRVIPVVPDDVAPQVVIIGVDPGHDVKSGIGKDANPAPEDREAAGSGTQHLLNKLATHSD